MSILRLGLLYNSKVSVIWQVRMTGFKEFVVNFTDGRVVVNRMTPELCHINVSVLSTTSVTPRIQLSDFFRDFFCEIFQ